ncbi:MAG: hemerythrin domain-containing protein [Flavisolibacter sp.]
MEEMLQPIKRSKQLAPLSREHHDGLLFAWKLRQGLDNDTSIETLRSYCQWYWKNHISQHFRQEEDILLQFIPSDHGLAIQLKDEHNDIRELIHCIDHQPDATTIRMLADFICRHIRFEERILFTYLEKILTPEQLGYIQQQVEIEPTCSTEFKEQFWI